MAARRTSAMWVLVMTTNAGARGPQPAAGGLCRSGGGGQQPWCHRAGLHPRVPATRPGWHHPLPLPWGGPRSCGCVDKNLKELQVLLDEKKVTLQVSAKLREWLADKGYDPAFGARPMARLVEEQLKRPLADEILFGKLQKGGKAKLDLKEDKGPDPGLVTGVTALRPGRMGHGTDTRPERSRIRAPHGPQGPEGGVAHHAGDRGDGRPQPGLPSPGSCASRRSACWWWWGPVQSMTPRLPWNTPGA